MVASRLIVHAGGELGTVYGRNGKQHLLDQLPAYNNAARNAPWLVLLDLDQDFDCAPPFRTQWMPNPSRFLSFRLAVRAVEAWLLADSEMVADFLRVSRTIVPESPDDLAAPKQVIVNLARRSRKRAIKTDMVPRVGSGRSIGPAYTSRLMEFATNSWRPAVAAERSDSLRRALNSLTSLVALPW